MRSRILPALLLLATLLAVQPASGSPGSAFAQKVFSQAGRALLLESEAGLEMVSLVLRKPLAPGALGDAELGQLVARLEHGSAEGSRLAEQISRRIAWIESDAEASSLARELAARPNAGARRKLEARLDQWAASELSGQSVIQRTYFASDAARNAYAASRGRFVLAAEPDAAVAHESITTDLFNGIVVRGEPFRANGNFNSMWKVDVYNPRTGRVRSAVFKPRTHDDGGGWNRVPMEYVAYSLNLKLGMDYVPPAAYRFGFEIGDLRFAEGSLSFFVPESRVLAEVPEAALPLSRMAIQSDNRILSVLLHNGDAHFKNLLAGQHWADGATRPVFIDFGASLKPGTRVTLTQYPAHGNDEAVFWVRARTLGRLRKLSAGDFEGLEGFLTREEIQGILSRRDGIVRHFDRLRSMYGDEAILLRE